ncbi:MAG: hypothetical protein GY928_08775 [Colwellia sp.]|nr:hypothetical protein [Colwellia sp.]
MANLFNPKKRHVLPNWRSFGLTANLGELDDWQKYRNHHSRILSIKDYLLSWEQNKTIAIAGDLLSAAFVNGFTENQAVKEAASFVLANQDKSTNTLLSFAEKIITPHSETQENRATLNNLESFQSSHKTHPLIRNAKNGLKQYIFNPILYVELSRLYSLLGHKDKAVQNMSIALHLAPENRFVLRAASRLYTHFGAADKIHHFIKNSKIVQHDPWVMSAEIALATIINRSSSLIKKGRQMIKSGKYAPFSLTELAASIGTLEFSNGNRRKTKELLQTALVSPNDNSLAQFEWISNKMFLFEINPIDYEVHNKYEALAREYYHNKQWDQALKSSVSWFCDLPFSKQPVMYGSHIANDILDKREIAIKLLRAGLVSHPNDAQIINNLAYSLALGNNLSEAESYIRKLRNWSKIDPITKICLNATNGLISFRKGQQDKGRYLYLKAIEETRSSKNGNFKWLAELNYAREEILYKTEYVESVIKIVNKIPEKTEYPQVNKLKESVIKMYHKTMKK